MDAALRPAVAADAPALAALADQLGYPNSAEEIGGRLAGLQAMPGHAVLVATAPQDGAVVGWIHVGSTRWLESDPCAEIGGLVIDQAWRGRRIGERLVRAGIAWAAEQGFGQIRVRSNVVRADAHRFYERLGFARVKAQAVFTLPLNG